MSCAGFPFIGFGIGLRRPHYRAAEAGAARIDWFEAISENFMVPGGRALEIITNVRAHYPVVLHGVSMSLGSTDPLDREYLNQLKALARRLAPAWISDHLCWTGVRRRNAHDLLPLPYTEETVRYVAGRIREIQDFLGQRILIENITAYLTFRESRLREWEFVRAVAEEADCGILLDINNIFVNAFNHGFNPYRYIDAMPAERVGQFHLAGHSIQDRYLIDTHDNPIRREVWKLYEYAVSRFGPVSTLIEWDDAIPGLEVLVGVANEAKLRQERVLREVKGADEHATAA